jgi:biopolymer transport protein ExbD
MLVLLIFMVAAPMMQQGLNVNLPQQRRAADAAASDPIYIRGAATFGRNASSDRQREIRLDVLAERIRQRVQHAKTSRCSCAATAR